MKIPPLETEVQPGVHCYAS